MAAKRAGPLLRRWREQKGLSTEAVARRLTNALGYDISGETIRRYEAGAVAQMQPVILAALINLYGKRIQDLPQDLADRVERSRDLLNATSKCTALPKVQIDAA